MSNPNLELLTAMAKRLRPLLEELVFVGGCSTGLLVSDTASAPIRPTTDVDVMVEIVSRGAYYALAERLREIGFQEDTSDNAPICRWIIDSMVLDVLPRIPRFWASATAGTLMRCTLLNRLCWMKAW